MVPDHDIVFARPRPSLGVGVRTLRREACPAFVVSLATLDVISDLIGSRYMMVAYDNFAGTVVIDHRRGCPQ